jgi:hypothetical protein
MNMFCLPANFIEEACKFGERYPATTLYSVVCGLPRHLQTESDLAISLLAKNEVCIVAKKREICSMYKMLIRMKYYIKNTNEREKLYNVPS